MISNVVSNDNYLPARTRTDLSQLFQKIKVGFGIKTMRFSSIDQFPIPQPYRPKVSHASSSRMMPKHRIFRLGRNPHPTPGAILLKMDLIQSPKIHGFVLSQPAKFFLLGDDPPHWQKRFGAAVSLTEIPAAERAVGTDGLPTAHPIDSECGPRAFSHPRDSQSARNRSAIGAGPFQSLAAAFPQGVAAVPLGLTPPIRSSLPVRIGLPNTLPSGEHRQADLKHGDNLIPALPAIHHAIDDHNAIRQNAGSHLGAQVLQFLRLLSLVASCHYHNITRFYAQLIMSLSIEKWSVRA